MTYLLDYAFNPAVKAPWPGQHSRARSPNLTVNGKTKIAIDGRDAYILDDDRREVKLPIAQKIARTPPEAPPQSQRFGITLSPNATVLWNEISRRYGKPIREETLDGPQTRYGYSDVYESGTPFIQLRERDRTEEELAHELLHLKLRLAGYPASIEIESSRATDGYLMAWLAANLRDIIEHWIFYPQIMAMGLTPDPETSRDMRNMIQQDRYPTTGDTVSVQTLSVTYFRTLTLPDQTDLAEQMKAWYLREGWAKASDIGDQMFAILTKEHPDTPKQEMTVFLECANILFMGDINFRENGWSDLPRGNVVLRKIKIDMVRNVPCAQYLPQN